MRSFSASSFPVFLSGVFILPSQKEDPYENVKKTQRAQARQGKIGLKERRSHNSNREFFSRIFARASTSAVLIQHPVGPSSWPGGGRCPPTAPWLPPGIGITPGDSAFKPRSEPGTYSTEYLFPGTQGIGNGIDIVEITYDCHCFEDLRVRVSRIPYRIHVSLRHFVVFLAAAFQAELQ